MVVFTKIFSLFIGFSYVFIVGAFTFPYGLQLAIYGTLMTAFAAYILWSKSKQLTWYQIFITCSGIICSLLHFYISNLLLQAVLWLGIIYSFSSLLILQDVDNENLDVEIRNTPESIWEYFIRCCERIVLIISKCFSVRTWKELLKPKLKTSTKLNPAINKKALLMIPVLSIFAILFSQVNDEFSKLIEVVFTIVADVIEYILNIDIIFDLIMGAIQSIICYSIFCPAQANPTDISFKEKPSFFKVKSDYLIVFGSLIFIFFLFSIFQSKLIFLDIHSLTFKEFSKYTQKGFWQLLFVSVLGYCFLRSGIKGKEKKPELNTFKSVFGTLIIFCSQLGLIGLFSYHKLYFLQNLFGLKDQRILATLAVSLILLSFVLLGLQICKKMCGKTVYTIQSYSFLMSLILLGVFNMEAMVTKYNPISYHHNGKRYLDYSYLLTNSYDNFKSWPEIIKTAQAEGIPEPKNYYWGAYESICGRKASGYSRQRSGDYYYHSKAPFKVHLKKLSDEFKEKKNKKKTLKELFRFNLNKYRAYKHVENNKKLYSNFLSYQKEACRKQRVN